MGSSGFICEKRELKHAQSAILIAKKRYMEGAFSMLILSLEWLDRLCSDASHSIENCLSYNCMLFKSFTEMQNRRKR
jgi:hypothetical protein